MNRYQTKFAQAITLLTNIKAAADEIGVRHFDKNFDIDMAGFKRRLEANDKTEEQMRALYGEVFEVSRTTSGYPKIQAALVKISSYIGSMPEAKIDDKIDEERLHPVKKVSNAGTDKPPGGKNGQVAEV